MNDFVIDQEVKEDFEYIRNLCELLSEFRDSKFEPPMQMTEIEQWEKDNNTKLPDQYKSWLLLTSYARIAGGLYTFEAPIIGSYDEDDDVIIAASIIGDGETLLISRESGAVFSDFDGEMTEFESFEEFLVGISVDLERLAKEYLGESWEDIYDETF